MSLVRYSPSDSRSVVLRHQQTLVLYDPQSQQIILREASPDTPLETASIHTCPYCKRPLDENGTGGRRGSPPPVSQGRSGTPLAESGFVDRDYFKMLERSSIQPGAPGEGSRRTMPFSPRPLPRLKPEDTLETEDGSMSEFETEAQPGSPHSNGINTAAFSPGYFERFFTIEKELGKGGKGVVLLVKHSLDGVPLGHFACKRVPVGDDHDWLKKVLIEVQLLQRLAHQNLVAYRHVWLENFQISSFGPKVPCAFILQQYCNAGDLQNYVIRPSKQSTKDQLKDMLRRRSRGQLETPKNGFKMPFDQIIAFFRDITSGLHFLHSHGFIHRDLKPQNCLLNEDIPGGGLRCLVSDFGEVQQVDQLRNSTGTTGTISYCAPEVLRRVTPDGRYGNFTTKSDIFSLGMILHFMCFSRLPYSGADCVNEENEDVDALRAEISAWRGLDEAKQSRADLPERLYHNLKTLINPDPQLRPTGEEILMVIEKGIGDEVPLVREQTPRYDVNPPDPLSQRRPSGANGHHQPSVMDDISSAVSFRRISPVADTPPPSTPRSGLRDVKLKTPDQKTSTLSRMQTLGSDDSPVTAAHKDALIVRPPMPLTPPPRGSATSSPVLTSQRNGWTLAFKLAVFVAKIAYMSQPCTPHAVSAWIYYPLMALAAVDVVIPISAWTLGLGILHFLVVATAYGTDRLCVLQH